MLAHKSTLILGILITLFQVDRQQLGEGAGVPPGWYLAQVHHITGK
jgi:hypothetical protein